MASNWRLNVHDYGMSDTQWELCAHVSNTVNPYLLIVKQTNFPTRYLKYRVIPGSLPIFVSNHLRPVAHPHFPYGNVVDAD